MTVAPTDSRTYVVSVSYTVVGFASVGNVGSCDSGSPEVGSIGGRSGNWLFHFEVI
jgi:hypothetical protein